MKFSLISIVGLLLIFAISCSKDENKNTPVEVPVGQNPGNYSPFSGQGLKGTWTTCFPVALLDQYVISFFPGFPMVPKEKPFYQATVSFSQDRITHVVDGTYDRCGGYLRNSVLSASGGFRIRGPVSEFAQAQDVLVSYDQCQSMYFSGICGGYDPRNGSVYQQPFLMQFNQGTGELFFGRHQGNTYQGVELFLNFPFRQGQPRHQ